MKTNAPHVNGNEIFNMQLEPGTGRLICLVFDYMETWPNAVAWPAWTSILVPVGLHHGGAGWLCTCSWCEMSGSDFGLLEWALPLAVIAVVQADAEYFCKKYLYVWDDELWHSPWFGFCFPKTWTLVSLTTSSQPISLCPEVALHRVGVCHAVAAVQFVFTVMCIKQPGSISIIIGPNSASPWLNTAEPHELALLP